MQNSEKMNSKECIQIWLISPIVSKCTLTKSSSLYRSEKGKWEDFWWLICSHSSFIFWHTWRTYIAHVAVLYVISSRYSWDIMQQTEKQQANIAVSSEKADEIFRKCQKFQISKVKLLLTCGDGFWGLITLLTTYFFIRRMLSFHIFFVVWLLPLPSSTKWTKTLTLTLLCYELRKSRLYALWTRRANAWKETI